MHYSTGDTKTHLASPIPKRRDCVMDGPTLAFFIIGLAIVALFLILMIQGD
jgi:hypothetical protein